MALPTIDGIKMDQPAMVDYDWLEPYAYTITGTAKHMPGYKAAHFFYKPDTASEVIEKIKAVVRGSRAHGMAYRLYDGDDQFYGYGQLYSEGQECEPLDEYRAQWGVTDIAAKNKYGKFEVYAG